MSKKPLSWRDRFVYDRFCREYFIDYDLGRAAKVAGVTRQTAARWLKEPYCCNKLDELARQQANRLEITADSVTQELARIAFVDIASCFDDDGKLLPLSRIPENSRRAIAGLDWEELAVAGEEGERIAIGAKRKMKLLGKVEALKLLGEHLGLWKREGEQTAATVNVVINGIIKDK